MTFDRTTMLAMALLAITLALTAFAYWPGLPGPLVLDDLPQLQGLIEHSAYDPATVWNNYIVSTSGPLGRPVSMASFIVDALAHGPDTWWWKYGNVMYHLISGLLICWLTALLLQALPQRMDIDPWLGGAFVAAIWLLHPLQVSTVLYTVQRMTELSTLFVLAGLVCYVKGRLLQEQSVLAGWAVIACGFLVFFPLAVFAKENALLYPVYCSLVEVLILQFRGTGVVRAQTRAVHGILLFGYLAALVVVLSNFSAIVLDSYASRDFGLGERVLTQFRVIVTYLAQILVPAQNRMGFFHDDLAVSTGLLSPVTTIVSAAILAGLLGSAIGLWRRLPLYTFGVLFFFASHAVESTVLGLELMFEHRNYAGTWGVILAVLGAALYARKHARALAVIAVVCVLVFTPLTWQRAATWSSPNLMYFYMYQVHPESPRLNLMFSNVQASAGAYDNARQLLARVRPGIGKEFHRLFLDCLEHKTLDNSPPPSIGTLRGGVIDGHATSSADSLVQEIVSGRCEASAQSVVGWVDHALAARDRTARDRVSLLYAKAQLLEAMNEQDAAISQYLAAQQLSEDDALPTYMAADALLRFGRFDEAREVLKNAARMETEMRIQRKDVAQTLYSGLAAFHERRAQFEDALAVYDEARTAMPKRSIFPINAARLLLRLQRYDEVEKLLNELRAGSLADIDRYTTLLQRIEAGLEQAGGQRD